jgi:hypothetical protein
MPTTTNNNARVNAAIQYALAQVGKPYVWATAGPNSYDCSGLIWKAYEVGAGYKFQGRPTTYTLVGMGREVPKSEIRPGDLVFPNAGHVQMSLGGTAIVEAANPRTGVRRSTLGRTWHIRRLIENNLEVGNKASGTDPKVSNSGGSETDAQLASINQALSSLTNPNFWVRILYIILGIIMCLVALARMGGADAIDYVSEVTK